jgi:phosphoribulokinase
MAAASPLLIGIVGDSGSGKTTLSMSIAAAFGQDRTTLICLDDYHRFDREERIRRSITALSPECNRLELMAEQLGALRRGESITKPVYDHHDGTFGPPETVQPREVVVARGLLGLHTDALAHCFDLSVFLDPEPALRVQWKIARDCAKRGYTMEAVLDQIDRRRPDAERYIAPQRERADLVIRFARHETGTAPTIQHGLAMQVFERNGRPKHARPGRGLPLMGLVLQAAESARDLRSGTFGLPAGPSSAPHSANS